MQFLRLPNVQAYKNQAFLQAFGHLASIAQTRSKTHSSPKNMPPKAQGELVSTCIISHGCYKLTDLYLLTRAIFMHAASSSKSVPILKTSGTRAPYASNDAGKQASSSSG